VRATWILVAIACAVTPVAADPAADVRGVLDKIEKDPAGRAAAIEELNRLAPGAIDVLGPYLSRPHTATVDDRRKALEAIEAQVPDEKGHFKQPERKTEAEEKKDDDLDWMVALQKLDASTPGAGEVIADDAVIRALAASKDMRAAQILFDASFGPETIIYRDECGRYLRKMQPYSVPALIKESQGKDYDRKRYATYQLERLDRQDAFKALQSGAGDEAVTIAILDVFRTTKHREAVHAVWSKVNADSPRVRKAARDAWMAYISGPPPPPAPRKKLMLPGGKLTKKEKPLWLTYRELADNELRKALNEYFGEDLPLADPTLDDSDEFRKPKTVKIDLVEKTNQMFNYFDEQRKKTEGAEWSAAKDKADKGDLAGAIAMLDGMLVRNPDRGDQAAMAALYMKWGKHLEDDKKWPEAANAYSKAAGLDPKGPSAKDALAAHYFTLGKAVEAGGKDGSGLFREAIGLKPDYAPAKKAAAASANVSRPTWMLYLALVAILGALGLFATVMVRRRA
jgi:tetratricopeptide (TPR) repeat protein